MIQRGMYIPVDFDENWSDLQIRGRTWCQHYFILNIVKMRERLSVTSLFKRF